MNETYGGYRHRQVPGEDEELTHVGPGTPGGEYLRRYWHPVIYSEELTDLLLDPSTSSGRAVSDNRAKANALLDESLAISTQLGMRPLMERVLSRQEILNT